MTSVGHTEQDVNHLSPPAAPPSPPTPKVSDWTRSTVDLEWIPPLKDGGSKILGYWVEYKEEDTEAWVKVRGDDQESGDQQTELCSRANF